MPGYVTMFCGSLVLEDHQAFWKDVDCMTWIKLNLPSPAVFIDPQGVTHEALDINHRCFGTVSLCGQLRDPVLIEDKTIDWLLASASLVPPEGVDCITCLVRRTRLSGLIDGPDIPNMVYLDIEVEP